ncbi:hypothetical protein ACFFMM_30705 [Micromonospora chaiyaphumensis]|uniref:Uncharacterized protein n=1 Tax=Micromonospora chaiyaphumensis TaxID=307119 RepID=A0A1C4X3A3_9ACTN|nr:hypothetical protein [Micromonospora chaiyaphumensis]SCF02939.1 hypothetical protein GA0070214_10573 [Micromonospora chaiyaphumensis]
MPFPDGADGQRRATPPPAGVPPMYVRYLRDRLLEAEAGLTAMSERYERTKAGFDRRYARRGITPDTDIVGYVNAKALNPELKFWYAKVEHFQRELAAYGAALTGLAAADRLLAAEGPRIPADRQRSRTGRPNLNRVG